MYKNLLPKQKEAYISIVEHIGWSINSLKGYDNLEEYHKNLWSEKQAYCIEEGYMTGLRLKQTAFKNIALLKDLPALIDLNLEECIVEDIESLISHQALKSINLAFNEIKNLDLLNQIPSLEKINIKGCYFGKTPTLKNLTHLTYLNLSFNEIKALSNFPPLPKLKNLYLSDNKLSTLDGLQQLEVLEELWINNNNIKDLSPLHKNRELKTIVASNNNYISGFAALAALPYLEELSIGDSLLLTVEGIGALQQLKTLDAQSNRLNTLGDVKELNNLVSLNLNMNAIEDITDFPINSFKHLKHFYISQNKLKKNIHNEPMIEKLKSQIPDTSFR